LSTELFWRLWQSVSEFAERFWEWTTHDPVAFYTFVLSVSTIALWFVTWRGVRNQTRETQILQRAYLSVEPAGIQPHVDRGDRVVCSVTFRNVGHLPARNVRWYGECLGSPPTDAKGDFVFPIGEFFPGKLVLAPGANSTQAIGIVYTMWPHGVPEEKNVGNAVFV
jgi:hypothetical protein